MNNDEIQKLQKENAAQLAKMNVNAAGMVQSLLLDLGLNGTYIKLTSAEQHHAEYEFKAGTKEFVKEIGAELGLSVSDSTIEVPHA